MNRKILIQNLAVTRLMLLYRYLPSLEARGPAKSGKLESPESATCMLGPCPSHLLIPSIGDQSLSIDLVGLPRKFLEDWW